MGLFVLRTLGSVQANALKHLAEVVMSKPGGPFSLWPIPPALPTGSNCGLDPLFSPHFWSNKSIPQLLYLRDPPPRPLLMNIHLFNGGGGFKKFVPAFWGLKIANLVGLRDFKLGTTSRGLLGRCGMSADVMMQFVFFVSKARGIFFLFEE